MGNYADLIKAQHETKPKENLAPLEPRNPAAKEPRQQGTKAYRRLGSKGPRFPGTKEARERGTWEARKHERRGSRINERADKDATFQFAERELDALDMLCIELKRELGEKPKKYDIIRAGLQHVIEDYHQQREKSLIIHRLRRKR